MSNPLQHQVVHVKMSGVRHGRGHDLEEREWVCEDRLDEASEVLTNGGCHDHKDDLKAVVVGLQLVLCPLGRLEREEDLEDNLDERRQEGDHHLEAQCGSQALPVGLQDRAEVDHLRQVGDADHQRHVREVQADDRQVAHKVAQTLRCLVLDEVLPKNVLRRRRRGQSPLLGIARDAIEAQGDLGLDTVGEGDEAAGEVDATNARRRLADDRGLCSRDCWLQLGHLPGVVLDAVHPLAPAAQPHHRALLRRLPARGPNSLGLAQLVAALFELELYRHEHADILADISTLHITIAR
mmetsp:Transcript_1134/g.2939  ORF Transcript_1134/g.2939 Transcript_1134/m.2939 type:complete len:295 (-) Transcript_1134:453-1337(-)